MYLNCDIVDCKCYSIQKNTLFNYVQLIYFFSKPMTLAGLNHA